MHWDSSTVRIESSEPMRANMGSYKDTSPAAYGFVREYHVFTTKKLSQGDLNGLFRLQNPLMPGMPLSSKTENQLIFGVAREYTSYQNLVTDGLTFDEDWRLTPTYENIIGNGYPVAQGRIFYTRLVWCWLNSGSGVAPPAGMGNAQGIDIPAARVSLMGRVVKPANFNDHMAVLANNEGIGSW